MFFGPFLPIGAFKKGSSCSPSWWETKHNRLGKAVFPMFSSLNLHQVILTLLGEVRGRESCRVDLSNQRDSFSEGS